jgi:formylglycine-generating enzyme required for sulfatase activity
MLTTIGMVALAVGLAAMSCAPSQETVPLAEDGTAAAVIVHNGQNELAPQIPDKPLGVPKGKINPPATELQVYLEKMTGAKLPLVASLEEAGEKPAIVLQVVEKVPGASDKLTGTQAYRLHTEGNRLYLTAANRLGLHNAVYGFLEDHLDCHFYSVNISRHSHGVRRYEGPGYEVVPERPTLALEQIDDLQEPALPNRGLIFKMGQYPWILQNRGISGTGGRTSGALASGHTMYSWINPEDRDVWVRNKEGKRERATKKGLLESHPEFFPMNKQGERDPDMHNQGICGTAEGLPAHLATRIRESLGNAPKDTDRMFKIGQGDGFQGCHCPDCRKLVHEKESEAAPLILMFNRTLDIVNETYPNVQIITFCYFNSLEAPEKMKVHDNLWINVVSSARSKNHAGDQMGLIVGNPANDDYARALKEWPRIAPDRVTVWHWDTYRAEWPSMFYVDDNVRYMVDNGVFGINPQTCGGPWSMMLNWLYMKLAWNPELDGDALIRQYLEDNYSEAAAPHVYKYLETARDAYEDALWVPSAVRWSGWTRITMDKLFPESVRAKLVPLMDKAVAAAEAHGTEAQLENLIAARVASIDKVALEAFLRLYEWGLVEHKGRTWYVPGADVQVPAILERATRDKAGSSFGYSRYIWDKGGPVVKLAEKKTSVTICPELKGKFVAATLAGKQLLDAGGAVGGYEDEFHRRVWGRLWMPAAITETEGVNWAELWREYRQEEPNRLATRTDLRRGGHKTSGTLHRTVTVADGAVRIERSYSGDPAIGEPFSARWRLALPFPKKSRVTVKGGGIKELMDLRYARPGGIRTVKAGQRPPGYEGLDAMAEKWDAIQAVSDAQVTGFEVTKEAGELEILLDRGDGLGAVVTTPAAGWSRVEVKPVVGENYLEITLVGDPAPEQETVERLPLPAQTLSARSLPAGEAVDAADEAPAPRLKLTGETTAVNEIDGAELVWIPAGTFARGSDSDLAGADEQPVRAIHLDGYWVYKHPVTVGQYKAFCEATGREFKPPWPQQKMADPRQDPDSYAVITNWFEAAAYARWARGALPTEAQWEKAARGPEGREYPWGDEYDPAKCVSMENTLYEFNEGFRPVGSHPEGASPYGVEDMAGNVLEWTRDWYRAEYYAESPDRNPTGPERGANKVVRGGCSLYDWRFNRSAARFIQPPAVNNWTAVGFRCVVVAPGPQAAGE